MPRAALPVSGRVVAVTGGARGIGLATARALKARGARVAVGDLDAGLAAAAGADLGAGLDVTDRDSFTGFLDSVESELGPLDVLVNNAGVMHVGPFLDESDEWTQRMFDINVLGVALGMKLALPRMLARGRGQVVNVASVAAHLGVAHEATYAATKHAVYGLSDSVRQELRGKAVDVTVVLPGPADTELAAGTTRNPRAIVLQPEDVAAAIVGAIERPRFDVYVPRVYSGLFKLLHPLPRPAREALLRFLGADAPSRATAADRAEYEARMASLYDPSRN